MPSAISKLGEIENKFIRFCVILFYGFILFVLYNEDVENFKFGDVLA